MGQMMSGQRLTDRVTAIVLTVRRQRRPAVQLLNARLSNELTSCNLTDDAIERVYIADAIEREWAIDLADAEIDGWRTLDDVTESIRRRPPRAQLRMAEPKIG